MTTIRRISLAVIPDRRCEFCAGPIPASRRRPARFCGQVCQLLAKEQEQQEKRRSDPAVRAHLARIRRAWRERGGQHA